MGTVRTTEVTLGVRDIMGIRTARRPGTCESCIHNMLLFLFAASLLLHGFGVILTKCFWRRCFMS